MIEIYHIKTKTGNVVGMSLYSKADLIDIFGKRAGERLIAGKPTTSRKQGLTRIKATVYNKMSKRA